MKDDKIIQAQIPLSEMFNYIDRLRSLTKGRGTFTMKFSHYALVPKHIQKQLIKKARGEE